MISMPSAEKMRGSQSMKLMWMSEPFLLCDQTEASRRTKKERENWAPMLVHLSNFNFAISESSVQKRTVAEEVE